MPFSLDVAICVAFAIPLFGLLLHVTMDGGERIRHGQVIENEETHARTQIDKDNRSIGRCLFIAVQSFGQQGIRLFWLNVVKEFHILGYKLSSRQIHSQESTLFHKRLLVVVFLE